jgi:hypothetical protein
MSTDVFGSCGCGKPSTYITIGPNGEHIGACNKYQRCKSSWELAEDLKDMYDELSTKYLLLFEKHVQMKLDSVGLMYKCFQGCGWVGSNWGTVVCYESPHSGEGMCPNCGAATCDYTYEMDDE